MSWGTKIAFLYLSFATMIGVMVYKSVTQSVDLVAPNYYEQELKYQDKIDGINNLSADSLVSCQKIPHKFNPNSCYMFKKNLFLKKFTTNNENIFIRQKKK